MSSEIAIAVQGLSKTFQIYEKPEHRLLEFVSLGRVRRHREFTALKDVSLEVRRGETVGIVGRNGCGKSTLLQLICGILQPTAGTVQTHGRIAALLELGAGFDGNFSGRENVYLNGAIHGRTRAEMDERIEAIAAFADIGEFIDRPVKTYSSGMFVRLAFATAVNVNPDILVVDEALAVGDEAFQRKCFARIEQIKERGATILFVSHAAQTIIQFCDRAVLMDAGEKLMEGIPADVVNTYQQLSSHSSNYENMRTMIKGHRSSKNSQIIGRQKTTHDIPHQSESHYTSDLDSPTKIEYESKGARIHNPRIIDERGQIVNILQAGKFYTYMYDVEFLDECKNVSFGMMIKSVTGVEISGYANIAMEQTWIVRANAKSTVTPSFRLKCDLVQGTYFLNSGVIGTTAAGETCYLARTLDITAFKVVTVEPNPIRGFTNMSYQFDIRKSSFHSDAT